MARRAVKGCCLARHHRCPAGHWAHLPPHWPVATTLAAGLAATLAAALAAALAATLIDALAVTLATALAASLERVHRLILRIIIWAIHRRYPCPAASGRAGQTGGPAFTAGCLTSSW
jgi:hypothetical protein